MATKHNVTASMVTEFVETQGKQTQALRDRMEADYRLWTLTPVPIGLEKGDYETMTSNRPRVFADKLVEELSSAKIKFTIPIYRDTKTERSRESMTEQAVIGLLGMADELITADPLSPPAQAQMAWYTTLGRFIVLRYWMYEDNEHGEKKIVPGLAVWDGFNVYWSATSKGLKRVCNVRWASKEEIEDRYEIKGAREDSLGRVCVYDYWDDNDETVIVDDKLVYEMEHKRGYPPVRIFASGSNPLIQGKDLKDTIKNVNESCFARGRDIWKQESDILSYYKTIVAQGTHQPQKLVYDSSLGGTQPDIEGNLYKSGANVPLDKGKGEDIVPLFTPVMPQDAMLLLNKTAQMGEMASAPDIFYGRLDQQATAQGTAMLIHAAMASLKQGKRTMEAAYTWLANEMIRQFKDGEFNDVQVQGMDGKENQFATSIKASELVTDRKIEATLDIETPQDELQNTGIASQLKKDELMSIETIMDKVLKIPDTDSELEKMSKERMSRITGLELRHGQTALIKDGDKDGAFWVGQMLEAAKQALIQQVMQAKGMNQPGGGQNQPGMPQPPQPGMIPGQNRVMPGNQNEETMRLAQMGLTRR